MADTSVEYIPHTEGTRFGDGRLTLFIGPMFSRKTDMLIGELTTCADVGLSVAYINHQWDVRETEGGDGKVSSHSSRFTKLSHKITAFKVDKLADVDVTSFNVIGIDESNFFSDLLTTVVKWVDVDHKVVFIAGLDGDAFRHPIGDTLKLIPHCNSVTKLVARCTQCLMDGLASPSKHLAITDAPFTARMDASTEQVAVGGKNKYQPMCRNCHSRRLQMNGFIWDNDD